MTQRLLLLFSLMLILAATAALVYTYPAERIVSVEYPQKKAQLTEWKGEALRLYHNDKNIQSELILQRILRVEPEDADALHLLALLRHKAEKFEAAEKICRQILHNAPDDAAAHNNLGILLVRNQKRPEGIRELSVAAALLPDEPIILYNLQYLTAMNDVSAPAKPKLPPAEKFPFLIFKEKR